MALLAQRPKRRRATSADQLNSELGETLDEIRESIGITNQQTSVPHLFNIMPPFTAENPQISFRNFLKRLNETATALGYKERDLCRILPLLLKGLAKVKYDGLPAGVKTDWRTLVTDLSKIYSSPAIKATAQHQLDTAAQGDRERIPVFLARITNLVEQSFPNFSEEEQRKIVLHYFLKKMTPSIRKHVRRTVTDPNDYAKTVEIAEQEDALLNLENFEQQNPSSLELTSLKADINDLTASVRTLALNNNMSRQHNSRRDTAYNRRRDNGYDNRNQIPYVNRVQNKNTTNNTNRFKHQLTNRFRASDNQYYNARPTRTPSRYPQSRYRNPNISSLRFSSPNRRVHFADAKHQTPIMTHHRSSKSPNLYDKIFTITVVCSIISMAGANAITKHFQICGQTRGGYFMEPPKPSVCHITGSRPEVHNQVVQLYAPRIDTQYIPAYSCTNRTRTVCTRSYFHFNLEVIRDTTTTNSVSVEDCRIIHRYKLLGNDLVRKINHNYWSTHNEVRYSYSFFGTRCETTTNFAIEYGSIISVDGSALLTDLTNTANCTLDQGECVTPQGTVIWNNTLHISSCNYAYMGQFNARLTNTHVLMPALQAAFIIQEDNTIRPKCIPQSAKKLTTGLFMYITNETFPRTVRTTNDSQKYNVLLATLPNETTITKRFEDSINSRIQYSTDQLQQDIDKNFNMVWTHLCNLNNENIQQSLALLRLDPTAGARLLLHRNDIAAALAGDAVLITQCRQVTPSRIFWSHRVNNTCYTNLPVEVDGHLYFAIPASNDLESRGIKVDCAHFTQGVYKQENGSWATSEGHIQVAPMPAGFKNLIPHKHHVPFTAPLLYHNNLAGIRASVSLLNYQAYRIDVLEHAMAQASEELGRNFLDEASQGMAEEGQRLATDIKVQASPLFQTTGSAIRRAVRTTENFIRKILLAIGGLAMSILLVYLLWKCVLYRYKQHRRRKNSKQIARYLARDQELRLEQQPLINFSRSREVQRGSLTKLTSNRPADIIDFLPQIHTLASAVGNPHRLPYAFLNIDGNFRLCLFDTGSTITYIRKSIIHPSYWDTLHPISKAAWAANGTKINFIGWRRIVVRIEDKVFTHEACVSEDKDCPADCLIGTDLISKLGKSLTLDLNKGTISIGRSVIQLRPNVELLPPVKISAFLTEDTSKFQHKWKGPFRVVQLQYPNVVIEDTVTKTTQKVHLDKVKRFFSEHLIQLAETNAAGQDSAETKGTLRRSARLQEKRLAAGGYGSS